MLVLDCAEVLHVDSTKIYSTQFREISRLDPETVEVNTNDVLFRLCKLSYETPAGFDGKLRLASGYSHGYQLEAASSGKQFVLPVVIAFEPTIYFPRAYRLTLERAKAGGTGGDKVDQAWMERHGVEEGLRSAVDGRHYQITPDTVLLEELSLTPA